MVSQLGGLHDVCPGFVHREVRHDIFGEPSIHLLAFSDEYGAAPAPARMPLCSTGHAPWPQPQGAVRCSVPSCAGSARVLCELAVIGQVTPPLAFQTAGGLLLAFLCVYVFLTDDQTVCEYLVRNISSRSDENDVTACLVAHSPVCWLDPARTEYGAIWQSIILFHLVDLHLLVWLEV